MLATLLAPDSGDALYNDVSAVKSPEEIRSQLAFLTTDLKPDMKSTPQHHVRLLCRTLPHIPKDAAQKRKKLLFDEFGIKQIRRYHYCKALSGTETKRYRW
ncbi:hypothetical protein [Ruminococcus flavefaciens]|uniref:hypothetical protein n=1 Tax=Ruminococcus flavefaciens TaxID=1265 RepID=UPI0018AD5700|nr:hypothetical protein [Ruminococcus flavefaciens]